MYNLSHCQTTETACSVTLIPFLMYICTCVVVFTLLLISRRQEFERQLHTYSNAFAKMHCDASQRKSADSFTLFSENK